MPGYIPAEILLNCAIILTVDRGGVRCKHGWKAHAERDVTDTALTCYQSYFARLSAQDEGTKELCTKLQHTESLAICQGE